MVKCGFMFMIAAGDVSDEVSKGAKAVTIFAIGEHARLSDDLKFITSKIMCYGQGEIVV